MESAVKIKNLKMVIIRDLLNIMFHFPPDPVSGGPGPADRTDTRHEAGGVCALGGRQPLLGGQHHHHMWPAAAAALRGLPG